LGFHIKGYVGILLLFVSLTMIGEQIHRYSMETNRFADQVIEFLQGRIPVDAPQLAPPEEGLPNPEEGAPPVKTVP